MRLTKETLLRFIGWCKEYKYFAVEFTLTDFHSSHFYKMEEYVNKQFANSHEYVYRMTLEQMLDLLNHMDKRKSFEVEINVKKPGHVIFYVGHKALIKLPGEFVHNKQRND